MGTDEMRTDVFVVGGGPAGLVAALAARRRGLQVILADAARPPIDKTCGEGLLPQTVAALKRLGVSLGPAQAIPLRGIRFIADGQSAEGAFPQSHGLGIRRTTLHHTLVERAVEAGVQCLWGSRVGGIRAGRVQLDSCTVACRWIIGADGQNSRVRKWTRLDRGAPQETRFGFRQHFRVAPWTDFVEVHWGRDCQIVVTPVKPDEVCLVLTSRQQHLRLNEALRDFPEIARQLQGHQCVTRDLGAVSALRIVRRVHRGNCALIGDASGSVDSLTGEGLGLAFRQAHALAEALTHNDLSRYGAAHRRINGRSELMTRLLLAMENRHWLRRRVITVLAKEPSLLERLIAIHAGGLPPRTFGLGSAVRLGTALLTFPL